MIFSPLTTRLASGAGNAWTLHYKAKELARHNSDIIVWSVGDPDAATPTPVTQHAVDALWAGRTHYTQQVGESLTREAVAQYYQKYVCPEIPERLNKDNIAIIAGTQAGMFATTLCLLAPSDEVIVPEPMYVTYPGMFGVVDAQVVHVPLAPERGFQLEVADIARAITPKTKAVYINSPNNPTGSIISQEELEHIASLCREHDLWLVSDEVYRELWFDAPCPSALSLPNMEDRLIITSSLSKSHAMSGWRAGWIIGPETLIAHLKILLTSMLYGSPPFIQDAMITALQQTDIAPQMRARYTKRRDYVMTRLKTMPHITPRRPAGGMFVMADVRNTGLSSAALAQRFFDQYNVSVLAADTFGPSCQGHVRLSLTLSDEKLGEACDRLESFLGGL